MTCLMSKCFVVNFYLCQGGHVTLCIYLFTYLFVSRITQKVTDEFG